MTRPVVVQPTAKRDVNQAADWYEGRSQGLGDEFVLAVAAGLSQIERMPEAHTLLRRGVRRMLLLRFPFALYYVVTPSAVKVFACQHVRRDSRHWLRRIEGQAAE